MYARKDINGTLVLTYDSSVWAKWLFGAAVVLLAVAGYDYFVSSHKPNRMIGLLAGAGVCALAGLALHETACTRIDPATRSIRWSRRIAFWREWKPEEGSMKVVTVTQYVRSDYRETAGQS